MQESKAREWWQDGAGFFGRRYMEGDDSVEGYRKERQTLEERTETEVSGVMKLLDLTPGQWLMDCPCGYGRHSIGLAKRGVNVVGVDINTEELEIAKDHVQGLETLEFVHLDMREIAYENKFNAIVNMFYSFGFFEEDEENLQVIKNFYRSLKPGGKFLMHTDVNISRVVNGEYTFSEVRHLRSGRRVQQVESYDRDRKRIIGTWTLLNDDNSIDALPPYSMRVYTYEEFSDICRSVGFQKITGYAYWDGAALTDHSEDMIIIAEK